MSETNFLRYLVAFEGGATAILATALAKHGPAEADVKQTKFWTEFAKLSKLPLSDLGPSEVRIEWEGVDLLVLWDDWAIVFEVKIAAGSVRRGQLHDYYRRLRSRLGNDGLLRGATHLAIIFLTPEGLGKAEIESLPLQEGDIKVHLHWGTLLEIMRSCFDTSEFELNTSPRDSFLSSLLLVGSEQIGSLLERTRTVKAPVNWTDDRLQCKKFALEVQRRVEELWSNEDLHFNPSWSDVRGDEVYANLGGNRLGNVYFWIDAASRIVSDEAGNSQVRGRLYFKVALRAASQRKSVFMSLRRDSLLALLAIPYNDRENFKVDDEGLSAVLSIDWDGSSSELAERIAALFCRFLLVFRGVMV